MSTRQILVSGCSYTAQAVWPKILYPDSNIINLGKPGAGNQYIAASVMNQIYTNKKIDCVFIMWTCINRVDLALPANPIIKNYVDNYKFGAQVGNTFYIFSGGNKYTSVLLDNYKNIKNSDWPNITSIDDYVNLPIDIISECEIAGIFSEQPNTLGIIIHKSMMLNYLNNNQYFEDNTYMNIINCHNLLEKHKIPYYFSWSYDAFDPVWKKFAGCLSKLHHLYNYIDWNKYIDLPAMDHGIMAGLLHEDGTHLADRGYQWANDVLNKGYHV
jgi:hypothetical protein